MSLATHSRSNHKDIATKAQLATHALLQRCAGNADWRTHDLLADQPAVQARASLWTHDEASTIDWDATTPLTAYTVLLLLEPARLSLHSDAHHLEERLCEAGSYYVSRPGEHVFAHSTGRCRALHVSIPVQLLWSGDDAGRLCFSMGPAQDMLLLQLARTLLEMQGKAGATHLSAQLMDLFLDRLRHLRAAAAPKATATRKTTLPNWRLQRVDEYVHAHLSEHVTLNDMASAAGLSPMHFAAQFRATTGYRPHHYLLLCRMEHAKQLMAEVPRSMLDIALEVGFQTQSHFTTVFKRLTGKTPRQWRGEVISTRQC
ncbi:AraC family transcriptional regulator [Dyella sp. C9]|uniref:helix-turn-helix transcriptional regulator n=1 Tax=Dyella sp. C9 TaxID=2202154 RepID=UPI000DEED544|nr:AraC family transcriptional regulator [Dyella sp. C9]